MELEGLLEKLHGLSDPAPSLMEMANIELSVL